MKEQPSKELLAGLSDPHMERVILGAMMLDGRAIAEATDRLAPDDFALDSNKRIFRCVTDMLRRSINVDVSTVRGELERRGELSSIGGLDALLILTDGIPRNYSIDSYVRLVKEKALIRHAVEMHWEAYSSGSAFVDDPNAFIERSIENLQHLR
jgi:replicative DNA helicase